ncbi:uncharacterized protein LOC142229627 [Haematobia irritans]|uniref:uncharacterized protein LOC142229627 n=1 Tax=Haematobia irritans TaxID=7368 RepID=UPI003F502B92
MDSIPTTPIEVTPRQKDKWQTINLNSSEDNEATADFETAVKACGFGRFNILLLCVSVPAIMGNVFETAVVSYILPSAECDLSLDLIDKGILNAIVYSGMIVSAIGWGYLADNKGRKNLLICGYLLEGLCVLIASMSQNVIQLMVAKFFGGFIVSGPFAILMSYLSEFHGANHRSQIMMIVGIMFSISNIILPVLALSILPNDWSFQIFQMNYVPWKVFLAISAIPSLLAALLFSFFPESPKFLMSQGRNSEAMKTFKMMYALNSGKPKETFMIKKLIEETQQKDKPITQTISTIESTLKDMYNGNREHCEETDKPVFEKHTNTFRLLCSKSHIGLCFVVCLMQFFVLLGLNTMRLWLPQLFASINEYEHISTQPTSMCAIVEYSVNKTEIVKDSTSDCKVIITPSSYTNNLVVAGTMFIAYLVAGTLINAIGNKSIQVIGLTVAGTCGFALYWSSSSLSTSIISALYVALGGMANTSSIGSSVNLFPTSLRTMIVSMSMMIGRSGSIFGNIMFPIFMSFGCIPPLVMIGASMFVGCILAASLPNSSKIALK